MAATEQLVDRACERTGLTDLGLDGWREGLDHLVDAVGTDIGEDPVAVARIEEVLVARLAARLRIEEWYAQHPGTGDHPVEGPVVIFGLPRTATTALQYLLAVDPQFRYQRRWEVGEPVPPPDLTTEHEDPRRLAVKIDRDVRHIRTVDGPMEDVVVLALHFHNQELGFPLPTYTRWWRDADLTTTFAYHERVLRLLHSQRPPYRWLLKAPAFLFALPELGARYPAARFVMTHRDPTVAFPSGCSTIANSQAISVPSVSVEPHGLGRRLLDYLAEGTRQAIAARAELGEDRFLDVGQHEMESDPLATVERVYAFLGLRLTDEVRSSMVAWSAENRRGARGRHEYSAEQFGCTPEDIQSAFGAYLERFGAFC